MHRAQIIIGFLILILFSGITSLQGQNARRAIYGEIGGNGGFYTINYEMRLNKQNDGLGGRVGIGYLPDYGVSLFSLPIMLNYLKGNNSHYLELGVGITYLSINDLIEFIDPDTST